MTEALHLPPRTPILQRDAVLRGASSGAVSKEKAYKTQRNRTKGNQTKSRKSAAHKTKRQIITDLHNTKRNNDEATGEKERSTSAGFHHVVALIAHVRCSGSDSSSHPI